MAARHKFGPIRDYITRRLTGIIPLLKDVVGSAIELGRIPEGVELYRREWEELGERVQQILTDVVKPLRSREQPIGDDDQARLEALETVLKEVNKEVKLIAEQRRLKIVMRYIKDPQVVADLKARVNDATAVFQRNATRSDINRIDNKIQAHEKSLNEAALDLQSAKHTATLDKLRRVDGASWNNTTVCLPYTRSSLIGNILEWAGYNNQPGGSAATPGRNNPNQATIMLLTAVAGGGKTTVAHTVAQRLDSENQLVSSFFFSRDINGRNTPTALFTTIAADLGRLDARLAERIASAIEDDPSLPSAPLARQFERLVLEPCRECQFARPMVVVIDALDEAWSDDLIGILCDRACLLPSTFRIFMTSRMRLELDRLCRQTHVRQRELRIDDDENKADVTMFSTHRLSNIADEYDLGDEWPGKELKLMFMQRAGGLFQWVATVCEYLRSRDDPTEELKDLLSHDRLSATSAEERMYRLYAAILEQFDWTDARFVAGYRRVMGMVIASKTPLSLSAMRELYREQALVSNIALHRLSPLLTGVGKQDQDRRPVQLLHQSLRDFLVDRAPNSAVYTKYQIVEQEYSGVLGQLSLYLLNRGLREGMPGTGYLAMDKDDNPGVPRLPESGASEALSYACQYWMDHVQDIWAMKEATRELKVLLELNIVLWLETSAALGRCRGLYPLLSKLEMSGTDLTEVHSLRKSDKYARACYLLSIRLAYVNRREEAVDMATEAVNGYEELVSNQLTTFIPDFAMSLNNLSVRLSDMGRREEALAAVEQGAELYRQLAAARPTAFTHELATSLSNLSLRLSDMGRREEALVATEQAVELYRSLAADRSTAFTPGLAMSLSILSSRLSDMGHREEALAAIEQAVELYRLLAADRSAAFTSGLAMSLNNMSNRLSDMGRRDEALVAIEQAAELYRQLAADRPAVFMPNLATFLNNLSLHLSDMGRRQESLAAIEQAAGMYQQLAADQPIAFTPNLARALKNLSLCLSDMGRRDEALAAIEKAVELRRQLAAKRPAAFTRDLAASLNSLSLRLSDTGRRIEALTAIEQAVELYRQLATERPVAFTPALAMSLSNLSLRLSDMGRHEEALAAIEQAVALRRQLAADRPAAFTPALTKSLNNLSLCLSNMEYHTEALAAIEQAVELLRQLAAERPAVFTPDLASALDSLSTCLSRAGYHQEALTVAQQALDTLRPFALDQPASLTDDLAELSANLAKRLTQVGRDEEALTALKKCVELYSRLHFEHPASFVSAYRESLQLLASTLTKLERYDEVAAVARQASAVH